MITDSNRTLYFLIGCIGLRSLLAYTSYKMPQYNIYIAIFTLLSGLGFMYIYYGGYRKTAYEAGGKVWWNKIRHVHGLLYLYFSLSVFTKYGMSEPWKLLATDVLVGISFWIWNRIIK